ncbi:hypothetical protein V8G54_000548 [Vigna mungo]|uniref:Uncharacterized protein n=1 Tax=Vigna mungo TaxID=3915 RepID=A0AAQ3P5I2_VIGMU
MGKNRAFKNDGVGHRVVEIQRDRIIPEKELCRKMIRSGNRENVSEKNCRGKGSYGTRLTEQIPSTLCSLSIRIHTAHASPNKFLQLYALSPYVYSYGCHLSLHTCTLTNVIILYLRTCILTCLPPLPSSPTRVTWCMLSLHTCTLTDVIILSLH